jgi:hypothetical protein
MCERVRGLETRLVCADCIGDEYLRETVANDFAPGTCFYCTREADCAAIARLGDSVEEVFEEHFVRTPDNPDDLEYAQARDDEFDSWWERSGELVVDIVEEIAGVSAAIAADIQQVLESRHYDLEAAKMGDELEFSSEARYAEATVGQGDWKIRWDQFRDSLRFQTRFFNQAARNFLAEMFDDLDALYLLGGASPIVDAGPGTKMSVLIRARCFQSRDDLLVALARPDIHIGPPSRELVPSGRMNARGIAVFYGATEVLTAVAEVRPPVGSSVAVVQFEIVRPIRLLDLEALRAIWTTGSHFDPTFGSRREKEEFLRGLSARLARPVMPEDEELEYLATQAVCDYLASDSAVAIDGLVYPSVQLDGNGRNIVLFHKSARLEEIVLPDGDTVSAAFGYTGEDEDGGFIVTQIAANRGDLVANDEPAARAGARLPQVRLPDPDQRPVTLRVDLESLAVHHVTAVEVRTDRYDVTRLKQND